MKNIIFYAYEKNRRYSIYIYINLFKKKNHRTSSSWKFDEKNGRGQGNKKEKKIMEPTSHESPMKKWTLARKIKGDKSRKNEHGPTKTKKTEASGTTVRRKRNGSRKAGGQATR